MYPDCLGLVSYIRLLAAIIMGKDSKVLLSLTTIGVVIGILSLFSGKTGGAELDDASRILLLTSVLVSITSLIFLAINIRIRRSLLSPLVFLIISFPGTSVVVKASFNFWRINRRPDLNADYNSPVSSKQYQIDSIQVANYIEIEKQVYNNQYGGQDITDSIVDTLIYSQSGDKIFVIYGKQFEKNSPWNDLDAAYLVAHRKDSSGWDFYEPAESYTSGTYHSMKELKIKTRKLYFNQFKFSDSFKGTQEYFWDRVIRR